MGVLVLLSSREIKSRVKLPSDEKDCYHSPKGFYKTEGYKLEGEALPAYSSCNLSLSVDFRCGASSPPISRIFRKVNDGDGNNNWGRIASFHVCSLATFLSWGNSSLPFPRKHFYKTEGYKFEGGGIPYPPYSEFIHQISGNATPLISIGNNPDNFNNLLNNEDIRATLLPSCLLKGTKSESGSPPLFEKFRKVKEDGTNGKFGCTYNHLTSHAPSADFQIFTGASTYPRKLLKELYDYISGGMALSLHLFREENTIIIPLPPEKEIYIIYSIHD